MYQQQHGEGDLLTPHESIITQDQDHEHEHEAPPYHEFANNYHDISGLAIPSNYPELDFHLQHDVIGSNYFTYHTDTSTHLGAPPDDMLYHQQDLAYLHHHQHQFPPNLNLVPDAYGSLPSESSGFAPGMTDGYANININTNGTVQGQFESSWVGVGPGRRQRGGAGDGVVGKGIEKKEKQRRERLGEKYEMLKALIPNRTKDDRATIVSDTIDYINELCRTVNDLKLLVEKKRLKLCSAGSFCFNSNSKMFDNSTTESSEVLIFRDNVSMNNNIVQRRSKEALVDVRIIEDEVNIKITEKKKAIGCLLPVSRAIDDLRLHLLNLAGGIIGECHVYMFNTQRMEGSSVYASAVAKKLIEVVDMY